MSNETTVFAVDRFQCVFNGLRLTAFLDTGTLLSQEKVTPDAVLAGGLFRTSAVTINGSDTYRITINIVPGTTDHQNLANWRLQQRATGRPNSLSASYEGSSITSQSLYFEGDPVRNWNADSTEVLAYSLVGVSEVNVLRFVNPAPLTEADLPAP